MRCERQVRRKNMGESRRCILMVGHKGPCSPDLSGMKIWNYTIVKHGTDRIRADGHRLVMWMVRDKFDCTKEIAVYGLLHGRSKGWGVRQHSGIGAKYIDGSSRPEYGTVSNHVQWITNPNHRNHKCYKGMPLYDGWNSKKGGSTLAGMNWILKHLGKKPGSSWSLDIIEHAKGFVPGNLRWALKRLQMSNQRHRFLGQISDKEFAVEAKRRGYTKRLN